MFKAGDAAQERALCLMPSMGGKTLHCPMSFAQHAFILLEACKL